MRRNKYQLVINVTKLIIHKTYEILKNQYITKILLIMIKKAFYYIFQAYFVEIILDLSINNDLIN